MLVDVILHHADEIRLLESRLVSHLAGINRDLQRRIRVRKSKGKW